MQNAGFSGAVVVRCTPTVTDTGYSERICKYVKRAGKTAFFIVDKLVVANYNRVELGETNKN